MLYMSQTAYENYIRRSTLWQIHLRVVSKLQPCISLVPLEQTGSVTCSQEFYIRGEGECPSRDLAVLYGEKEWHLSHNDHH